jgi:hypothetical protein
VILEKAAPGAAFLVCGGCAVKAGAGLAGDRAAGPGLATRDRLAEGWQGAGWPGLALGWRC